MSAERLTNPPLVPRRPIVRNEHEWKHLSPEAQAQAIFEFEKFWKDCAPSATGVSGVNFAPLVVESSAHLPVDFKGPGIGRHQAQADAENELREMERIKNQGL